MYENELTIFSTPATFMIDKEITREQASKFFVVLARIFTTIQPDISKIANFNDIEKADRTLKPYITEAFQMDIFQGTNNKFLPFNNLTQAQALAVITRVIFGKVHEERIAGKPRYQKYRDVANQYNILQNL
jgi:hypothetical protein